ncbi:MAG: carbohydrate-binding protein, partial [Chitinophagaceae bacterium]
ADLQYNWAEGPVMCKRNGFYYYFVAGSVAGGEYVLRTRTLTSDSARWERLGNFFEPITDPNTGFRGPNHIAAPIKLADGSWWTIAQSYERYKGSDWTGTGRQTSLYRVIWKGNRPWGMEPVSTPVIRPDLPSSGILWRSVHSDYFDHDSLNVCWHFLDRKAARSYSLSARKGWIQLIPDSGRTHLLQKETDHYYSAVTKVDLNADNVADKAGLYLTNGNQSVTVQLYSGYDNGEKMIVFKLDTAIREAPNKIGKVVWLKIERKAHALTGYYSSDGNNWNVLGAPISAVSLDKEQPNFNSWVGTSVGLFAQGKPAYFDFFICKDGFSSLPAVGYRNYFGIATVQQASEKVVTNTSGYGGWFVISGVDLGKNERIARQVEVLASSTKGGKLEIWLDGLMNNGKWIATITIKPTGDQGNFKVFRGKIKPVSGHHDVFVKFPPADAGGIYIKSIQFLNGETKR